MVALDTMHQTDLANLRETLSRSLRNLGQRRRFSPSMYCRSQSVRGVRRVSRDEPPALNPRTATLGTNSGKPCKSSGSLCPISRITQSSEHIPLRAEFVNNSPRSINRIHSVGLWITVMTIMDNHDVARFGMLHHLLGDTGVLYAREIRPSPSSSNSIR